jgi:hypothetical protein
LRIPRYVAVPGMDLHVTPSRAAVRRRQRPAATAGLLLVLLAACQPRPPADTGGAARPAEAVRRLATDLRRNDLAAWARHAVPPDLHAPLAQAWAEDRSRWPLTAWPLGEKIEPAIIALAAPGADQRLQAGYDRELAGKRADVADAARTLGAFLDAWLASRQDLDAARRDHARQQLRALSAWGLQAPLWDRTRAAPALAALTRAARDSALVDASAWRDAGMDGSLQRLGQVLVVAKRRMAGFGLDLDASLDSLDVQLLRQTGDTAEVQVRYLLAGTAVDAVLPMQRVAGHWYPAAALASARQALAAPVAANAAPTPQ